MEINEVMTLGETALYKIGQLAELADVSTRTIDYYTKIGMIEPVKRTNKNYRLYSDETLHRLKRIEMLKKEKYTLEEIRNTLNQLDKATRNNEMNEKLAALQLHMKQLEREVNELRPYLEQMRPNQAKHIFKHLTPHSAACIEALLLLIGKSPFI
jgi:MerR family copper efflux transcriptional regulator